MSGVRLTRHHPPHRVKNGRDRIVLVSSKSAIHIPKEILDHCMI